MDEPAPLGRHQGCALGATGVHELKQRVKQLEESVKRCHRAITRSRLSELPRSTKTSQCSKGFETKVDTFADHNEIFPVQVKVHFPLSYFRDNITSLSMSGLKVFGEDDRPWFYTYLWIFLHTVALLTSYVYIKEEYDNWQRAPVVRALSNNVTFVNEIPFPAITVCLPDSLKIGYDYGANLKKCYLCNTTEYNRCVFNKGCSPQEIFFLAVASLVCPTGYIGVVGTAPVDTLEKDLLRYSESQSFSTYLELVAPPCDVNVDQKRFVEGEPYIKGDEYFTSGCYGNGYQHFISSAGMCFTVNGLRHQDILKEQTVLSLAVKPESSFKDNYVGRNFTLGNMMYYGGSSRTVPAYATADPWIGLRISDRENGAYTDFCRGSTRSLVASVAIHNPVEIPFLFKWDFSLKLREYKTVRIIPELVTTDRSLESYEPIARGCLYHDERDLSMFKHYSESNCKTECLANCSLERCGCVPYYLPRHNSSVNVCFRVCDEAESSCDCGCLPDCNSLSYKRESVEVNDQEFNNGNHGIYIKYVDNSFYATVRVSITAAAQFMAYCLGIVAVFNGISFMVFCEVIYYLTLKLWNVVKN